MRLGRKEWYARTTAYGTEGTDGSGRTLAYAAAADRTDRREHNGRKAPGMARRPLLGRLSVRGRDRPHAIRHARHVPRIGRICLGVRDAGECRLAFGRSDASRTLLAPHARLLRHARRRGAARPQLAAAKRRILHTRAAHARGLALLRRVRPHSTAIRSRHGAAQPPGRSGQRLRIHARRRPQPAHVRLSRPTICSYSSTTQAVRRAGR